MFRKVLLASHQFGAHRCYAALAQAGSKTGYAAPASQKIGNYNWIHADDGRDTGVVSVFVKAGVRHETGYNQGVSHVVRRGSDLGFYDPVTLQTHQNSTNYVFELHWQAVQLTVSTTKELTCYTIQGLKQNLSPALKHLMLQITTPSFRPYDLPQVFDMCMKDWCQFQRNHELEVVERANELAFKSGVGQLSFAKPDLVNSFNQDCIHSFVYNHYQPDRMTIVSLNADTNVLRENALILHNILKDPETPKLKPHMPSPNAVKSRYFGGDQYRKETTSPNAHVCYAKEGASVRDYGVSQILANCLGLGPQVQNGYNDHQGKLAAAVKAKVGKDALFAIQPININYSDAGLFGFKMVCSAELAGDAIPAAAKAFNASATSISEADLLRAKKAFKMSFYEQLQSQVGLTSWLGTHASVSNGMPPLTPSFVDSVTLADVKAFANKMVASKPVYSLIGDVVDAPHLQDL